MNYLDKDEPWYLTRIRELENRIDRMNAEAREESDKELEEEFNEE